MIASGTSGTCTWKIADNGTLTVEPTNRTEGYFVRDTMSNSPWDDYSKQIKNAIFKGSIRIYSVIAMQPIKETGDANSLFSPFTSILDDPYENLESVVGLSSLKGVTYTNSMFSGCTKLTFVDLPYFDTSKVTDMQYMFFRCESLPSLDLSSFDTSKVTNMYAMFENCKKLTSLNLSSFSTSNVENMSSMFYSCASLASLDLSSFDTSKVTKMGAMFRGCRSLASLDLSSFDTSKVTEMGAMFSECESLESLQLPSSFKTANVTKMNNMFDGCKSLTSLDLSYFNTSKVTDTYGMYHMYAMSKMFTGCDLLSSITFGNYFEISSDIDIETSIGFGKGVNQDNGIFVPDDKAFLSLSTTERAGHWVRNVSEIYEVNAYRAEEGAADEGGSDVIIKVRWSTNAQTTDRTLSVFKKLNSESTYPSSAIITKTLSGNSGTEVLTLADAGSEAYDFKVQFYDGTNTFVAFPGVPATIELVIVNKEGDVQIKRNFWAAGTVTAKDMTDTEVSDFVDGMQGVGSTLLDFVYPVGVCFETSDANFNPNTALGGTWTSEQIEDDYVVDEINDGIWIGRKWASGKFELYISYSGVPTGGKHYWTTPSNVLHGYRVEGFVFPQGWKPLGTTYNVTVNWNIGSGFSMDSTYGNDANGFNIYALATQADVTNVQAKVLVTGYWKSFGSPTKYRWHRTA